MKFAILLVAAGLVFAQDHPKDAHHAAVDTRGDHAMGFSHEKTTHHFFLYRDGGAIQVTDNDPKDTESRDEVQMHLGHIAMMFTNGDFEIPMLVHDQVPPGVPVMKKFKGEIKYTYEKTELGGRVRIVTKNAEELSAIHEFLKFQITDHQTNDPLTIASVR